MLSTINQAKARARKPFTRCRSGVLLKCPHKAGEVLQLRIVTPRKPNSARRSNAKLIISNKKKAIAYLPGAHRNVRKHSDVLVRGRGPRDLPGVRHSCLRGVYDFLGVKDKKRRRSIYGVARPAELVTKLRRKFRKIF